MKKSKNKTKDINNYHKPANKKKNKSKNKEGNYIYKKYRVITQQVLSICSFSSPGVKYVS